DAGVEQDGCGPGVRADGVGDGGERVERGDGVVDLASAVVGHHDAVSTVVEGGAGVVGVLDAFDEDREAGALAQPREVGPGEGGAGEDVEEGLDGGARVRPGEVAPGGSGVVAGHGQQGADGG